MERRLCDHNRIVGTCRQCNIINGYNAMLNEPVNITTSNYFNNDEWREKVEGEIAIVLNRYNIDGLLNTPDFILSKYFVKSLKNLHKMQIDIVKYKA